MSNSMADYLNVVTPYLPSELASAEAMSNLQLLAQLLPPFSRAMLEFRLGNGSSPVDLSIFVDRRTLDLPDTLLTHPVWQSLQNFCREWVEPQSFLYRGLRLTGLEFDVGEPFTQVPIPSIFVAWHREMVTDDQALAEIVPKLPNYPISSTLEARLQQCVNCLPQGAALESIGVMLSRPTQLVRVITADIPLNQVLEYLMQIGWSEPSDEFSHLLLTLSEFGQEVRLLSFDVGEKIAPRVGLEFYPKQFPVDNSLWQLFLNHLVAMGLCTPTKKDALLAWPGFTQKADRPELWPSNLLVGDFLRGSTALSLFWRTINHVKIVYQPDTPLEAKGYLIFGHHWFDVNP